MASWIKKKLNDPTFSVLVFLLGFLVLTLFFFWYVEEKQAKQAEFFEIELRDVLLEESSPYLVWISHKHEKYYRQDITDYEYNHFDKEIGEKVRVKRKHGIFESAFSYINENEEHIVLENIAYIENK